MKRIRRQIRFDLEISNNIQSAIFRWIESKKQIRKYRTVLRKALQLWFLLETDETSAITMLQREFPTMMHKYNRQIVGDHISVLVTGVPIAQNRQKKFSETKLEFSTKPIKSQKPGANLAESMMGLMQ